MNNTDIQTKLLLESFGLSDKETNVYLSLLSVGRGTVSQISQGAGINRTTGYDILGSLISKRLVSISGKEPKQEYIAESPTNITEYLKRNVEEMQQLIKKSENLVPLLASIHRKDNRPKIKFYEGKDGLKTVYEDTLTAQEQIRAYATVDDMHNALPEYFPTYYKRRASKGISIRAIIPKTKTGIERSKKDKEEKREVSFVPPETYYFSPEINIYDNKVMIASWREQLGIIIESEEIADAMKKIYELAWLGTKVVFKDK